MVLTWKYRISGNIWWVKNTIHYLSLRIRLILVTLKTIMLSSTVIIIHMFLEVNILQTYSRVQWFSSPASRSFHEKLHRGITVGELCLHVFRKHCPVELVLSKRASHEESSALPQQSSNTSHLQEICRHQKKNNVHWEFNNTHSYPELLQLPAVACYIHTKNKKQEGSLSSFCVKATIQLDTSPSTAPAKSIESQP